MLKDLRGMLYGGHVGCLLSLSREHFGKHDNLKGGRLAPNTGWRSMGS